MQPQNARKMSPLIFLNQKQNEQVDEAFNIGAMKTRHQRWKNRNFRLNALKGEEVEEEYFLV
jgi:hypothetical protein